MSASNFLFNKDFKENVYKVLLGKSLSSLLDQGLSWGNFETIKNKLSFNFAELLFTYENIRRSKSTA